VLIKPTSRSLAVPRINALASILLSTPVPLGIHNPMKKYFSRFRLICGERRYDCDFAYDRMIEVIQLSERPID
jgi:hypothetical protein